MELYSICSAMSSNHPVPSEFPLVPRKKSEEWVLTAKRSCLNMTVMEPCVNKAVAHLEILKELAHKRSKGQSIEITKRISSALEDSKLTHIENSSGLVAEGFAIGIRQKTTDRTVN